MIDFNLGLIEGKAGVLVYASAGPDGSLGQGWRPLEPEETSAIEGVRQRAEPAIASLSMGGLTRDLAAASARHPSNEGAEETLRELGWELFRILVQDEVREVYERARSATLNGEQDALLFLLKFRASSSLQRVPWELLHDGYRFLAKDPRTAIVRYFEQPPPVARLEIQPPLRVLVTLANPRDMPPLKLEEEAAAIHAAYEEAGRLVEVVVKRNISLEKLEKVWRRAGNEGKPFHIWHHCGHGERRAHAGRDAFVLCLEAEGKSQPVSVDQLQEIVGFCPELRVAVFNVCHGGSGVGIVPALARLNVPVVVGFQQAVRDPAAVQFAAVLHEGLLHIPVELAVSQARSSLNVQRSSFDWSHALAFSRRRDRGAILAKRKTRDTRKSKGGVTIEIGTLGGTDSEVIGASYIGGTRHRPGDQPIHIKADEITGSGARLVGFESISGFSEAEIEAREARVKRLLKRLEGQASSRRQP